jgi:hypothetical protein
MKKYEVLLARSYMVTIQAKDKKQARRYAEFFIGDCPDLSMPKDRRERNFRIEGIKMVFNEAYETNELI